MTSKHLCKKRRFLTNREKHVSGPTGQLGLSSAQEMRFPGCKEAPPNHTGQGAKSPAVQFREDTFE